MQVKKKMNNKLELSINKIIDIKSEIINYIFPKKYFYLLYILLLFLLLRTNFDY